MQVAAGCAACVLVVVALAAVGETRRDMALAEAATSFQQDSEAAIKIKTAKEEYDQARGQVHDLKEGLTGLEERLSRQLKVMDAARDDLVKRIKRVEKLPDPAGSKSADRQQKVLAQGLITGGTALAAAPLKSLEALRQTSEKTSKVKGIAKRIMFPDTDDKEDPLTKIEDSVLKRAWGDSSGPSDWKCRVKPKTPGCQKRGKGRSRSSGSGHKSRKHRSGSNGRQVIWIPQAYTHACKHPGGMCWCTPVTRMNLRLALLMACVFPFVGDAFSVSFLCAHAAASIWYFLRAPVV